MLKKVIVTTLTLSLFLFLHVNFTTLSVYDEDASSENGSIWWGTTPGNLCDPPASNRSYAVGTELSLGTCEPKTGYRFSHWETDPIGVEILDITSPSTTLIVPAGDVRITPVFVPDDGRVLIRETFEPLSATHCIAPGPPYFARRGSEVTHSLRIPRVPSQYCEYQFSHWSSIVFPHLPNYNEVTDATNPITSFIVPQVDSILLVANFFPVESLAQRIVVGITVDFDEEAGRDDGLITFTTNPQLVSIEDSLEGYRFSRWESSPVRVEFESARAQATTFTVIEAEAIMITAVFVPRQTALIITIVGLTSVVVVVTSFVVIKTRKKKKAPR